MRCLSIAICCVFACALSAQGYTETTFSGSLYATPSPQVIWDGATAPVDDDYTALSLGFTFEFFGTSYSTVYVSTNGFISFTPLTNAYPFNSSSLPDSAVPNNCVFGFWDDLYIGNSGLTSPASVVWERFGSPGSYYFVIAWTSVPHYQAQTSSYADFEIVLFEGTNVIEIILEYSFGSIWTGTVGVENGTGGTGYGITGQTSVSAIDRRYTPSGGGSGAGLLRFSVLSNPQTDRNENVGTTTFAVHRDGGSSGAVSVDFATSPGTATAGSDYTSANGVLSWANGDASDKFISVTIIDDTITESTETFTIALTNPTGGASTTSGSNLTVNILDNDSGGGGPPNSISDANFLFEFDHTRGDVTTINWKTVLNQDIIDDFWSSSLGTGLFCVSKGGWQERVSGGTTVLSWTQLSGSFSITYANAGYGQKTLIFTWDSTGLNVYFSLNLTVAGPANIGTTFVSLPSHGAGVAGGNEATFNYTYPGASTQLYSNSNASALYCATIGGAAWGFGISNPSPRQMSCGNGAAADGPFAQFTASGSLVFLLGSESGVRSQFGFPAGGSGGGGGGDGGDDGGCSTGGGSNAAWLTLFGVILALSWRLSNRSARHS